MNDLNKVFLTGRIVKDIELSYTPSGMAIGKTSIAVNRSQKKDGEYIENTSFFELQSFGKLAEFMQQYVTKGKAVTIDGNLRQDAWQDKETGAKKTKIYIAVENINFLFDKKSNNDDMSQYDNLPF